MDEEEELEVGKQYTVVKRIKLRTGKTLDSPSKGHVEQGHRARGPPPASSSS